jgi:hypothetical protein
VHLVCPFASPNTGSRRSGIASTSQQPEPRCEVHHIPH